MSIEQIKEAITTLSPAEYSQLANWLKEHDFDRWDQQIAGDADSGRLDTLLDEVHTEFRAGLTFPL